LTSPCELSEREVTSPSNLKVVGALDNYSLVFVIFINFFGQLKDWVREVFFLVSCPKGQVEKYVNVEAWWWWSVLLVKETGVHGETTISNLRQVTYKLYHIVLYWVHLAWVWLELTTSVVIGTNCIGSCKSNYYTITTTMAPTYKWTSRDEKDITHTKSTVKIKNNK
jgi:hypothetical protein